MGPGGEAGRREAGLTSALARFLAHARWEDLPPVVRGEGRRGILNSLGCVLAGREDPALQRVRGTLPAEDAVLDAAAATAQDYDDTHLPTVIHATPPVIGALLALARRRKVSGAQLMHAFILGTETSCRLGNAVTPGHYERGWHITSTCGVFGAAAAAGKILGLDEKQFVCALGIAATQAAGLVEMLGSMARILNAGFAARNGMVAAQLAAQGFEGPREPIEGLRGFLNVFGGSKDLAKITSGLGERWEMTQLAYKPYPSGVVLHALIDGCLEHREKLLSAEEITVRMHPLAIERADRPEPTNAVQSRLSAQHAVAVAVVRGRAGLAEFSDAAALDPALQAFRRRVRIVADPKLDKMAAGIIAAGVTIDAAASRPMDDARLEAKFRELAGQSGAPLLQTIRRLEALEHFNAP